MIFLPLLLLGCGAPATVPFLQRLGVFDGMLADIVKIIVMATFGEILEFKLNATAVGSPFTPPPSYKTDAVCKKACYSSVCCSAHNLALTT